MVDHFGLAERLTAHGQGHLLQGIATLDAATRSAYLARLGEIDWAELTAEPQKAAAGEVGASRVVDAAERARRHDELARLGEAAYKRGEVGVLMVAGGQGTRLGVNGPKGCVPIAPHSHKSIYQLQAQKVLALTRRTNRTVPFLVMTSPMTDGETREYFAAHSDFGLAQGQVRFFCQGTVPSLAKDGRALLAAPGKLLENPDGHGGCFSALVASGELARLQHEGFLHLAYIQVDNLLAPVDDPVMVGLAVAERAEVITKVLEKADPDEKVGHLVRLGARDAIIEYTELSKAQVREKGPDGHPLYRWGSPAIHCWSVGFLARLAKAAYKPPLHRSAKPLKAWRDGEVVEVPGWKNERFMFDLIPQAERSLGLVITRAEEFAPVKNATGVDSAVTAVQLASDLYAAWLREAGVTVQLPKGATVEISPLFAATRAQLLARWDKRVSEVTGDYYLEEASTSFPAAPGR